VNFPADPNRADPAYKTAKGTSLPAHVYTAQDARGRYTMTVVNCPAAPDELAAVIEDAAAAVPAKGTVKYDGTGMLDNKQESAHYRRDTGPAAPPRERSWSPPTCVLISEADTTFTAPPPAQYQASLQILDDEGVRIRYRAVGNPERVR
jgi:hypothetical protein